MAFYYVDTSALVKRYLTEAGSVWVRSQLAGEAVALSLVAVPEMASALARRTREGEVAPQQRDIIYARFLADAQAYLVVDFTPEIANEAARLMLSRLPAISLRALDAIHVATARWCFRQATPRREEAGFFVAADRRLLEAANQVGLATLNPEEQPHS